MKNITKEDILNSPEGKELMIDFAKQFRTKFAGLTEYLSDSYDNFKQEQLKQKVDWEILAFEGKNSKEIWKRSVHIKNRFELVVGELSNSEDFYMNNIHSYNIHSVKRLSE